MKNQIPEWRGFRVGDRIKTLVPMTGEMPEGGEITYPAGTLGRICSIDDFGPDQGIGVTVSIGDWEGDGNGTIVNVFDDEDVRREGLAEDGSLKWFRKAD